MNKELRIKNETRKNALAPFPIHNSLFMIRYSQPSRGVSLLELLIYIALLAGIMVVVSDAFISLSKGRGRAEARNEVNAAIRFAGERIRQDLKGASAVTTPILGTPSATLSATVSGTTILYDTLTGRLRRTEGAGSPIFVTGTNVFVDVPTFTRLENYNSTLLATTTAVQVSMRFNYNASSTDWTYNASLRTTIDLR